MEKETDGVYLNKEDSTPIYKQIVSEIDRLVDEEQIKKGEFLPSVNHISQKFGIARNSVFKAYNLLRAQGIVDSWPGKGYFLINNDLKRELNIMLLLDGFASYKQVLYNSLLANLSNKAKLDIFFHHRNHKVFNSILENNADNYNRFIIVPPPQPEALKSIRTLPQNQVYILDQAYNNLDQIYPSVIQHFDLDIQILLSEQVTKLKSYKKLILIISKDHIASGIRTGFIKFCTSQGFQYNVWDTLEPENNFSQSAFICVSDNDLVELIQIAREKKLEPGKDIGIISYNETPLKSVIGNGISTISTDFKQMGKTMAEMVLSGESKHINNPRIFTSRKSL